MKIEAEKALSAVSPLWLKELNASRNQRRSPNQLEVWKVFIQQNAPEYPLFCQLLQIMISTSPNTSPLERSYTKLQMLTEKRRSRVEPSNLEIRYLISALDIPLKKPEQYELERSKLERR